MPLVWNLQHMIIAITMILIIMFRVLSRGKFSPSSPTSPPNIKYAHFKGLKLKFSWGACMPQDPLVDKLNS